MQELLDLLAGRNNHVSLDVAALQLATIEHPGLMIEPFIGLLDSHAKEFRERVRDSSDGQEFVTLLNEYLFDELGFQGNQDDYYNPANSCLNDVLTSRTGIPITLSLLYMEIARRLDRPVYGIGLPGHFIVLYDDGEFSTFIDPFNAGRLLGEDECFELSESITGQDLSNNPALLDPVGHRHIMQRMLNNLRAIYYREKNHGKMLAVLDLLISADPHAASEYKQRAICHAHLKQYKACRDDFEIYLKLAPEATDRTEVEQQLEKLNRWLATMN
ncbi:MAG TPA: transglutaminase-like domain-containing protein [Bryobacteraceae bacterium]|nr:transglutaminase-like domain-containing protein [Bryobacteraceae bacterium]